MATKRKFAPRTVYPADEIPNRSLMNLGRGWVEDVVVKFKKKSKKAIKLDTSHLNTKKNPKSK